MQRPFHIRLEEYNRRKNARVNELVCKKKNSRSSQRIRNFYKRRKFLRKCVVSSMVSKNNDNRPYILLNVMNNNYYALLDSGANVSVIGGVLCAEILNSKNFKKGVGYVRTADGQNQHVSGTINLEILYNSRAKSINFVLIPTIHQDIICGMDFWEKFEI